MPIFINEINTNIFMRSGRNRGITILAHFDKSWVGGRNKRRYAARLGKNLINLLDSEKVIVTAKGDRLEINAHAKAVGTVTSALSRLAGIGAYEVAYGSRKGRMIKGLGGMPSGTAGTKGAPKGIGVLEGTGVITYQGVRFRQPQQTAVPPTEVERPAGQFEGRPTVSPHRFSSVAIVNSIEEMRDLDIKHTTASLTKEDGKVHFYERHKNYNSSTKEVTNGGWVHVGVSNPDWKERLGYRGGRYYGPDRERRYIDGAYVSRDVYLSADSVVDGTSKVISLSDPQARGLLEEALKRNHTTDSRWLERRWKQIDVHTSTKGEAFIENSEILDNSVVVGAFVSGYKVMGDAIVAGGDIMLDQNLGGNFSSRKIKTDIFPGSNSYVDYIAERNRYLGSIQPSQNRIDKDAYRSMVRKQREEAERRREDS